MTGREWQPGDVAMVTEYDEPLLAMVGHRKGSKLLMFKYADGGFDVAGRMNIGDGEELDIAARPLVVIDPEDREQVERLWRTWTTLAPDHQLAQDNLQAALREFADPKPPKPAEPKGLGAVVEDEDGVRWVRARRDQHQWRHDYEDGTSPYRAYADINVARVLSEGVRAGEQS